MGKAIPITACGRNPPFSILTAFNILTLALVVNSEKLTDILKILRNTKQCIYITLSENTDFDEKDYVVNLFKFGCC